MHSDPKPIQGKKCNESSVLLASLNSEHPTFVLYNERSMTAILLGSPRSRFETLYFVLLILFIMHR